MPTTAIALIYCATSMRALSAVIPDDDKELQGIADRLRPGEAMTTIPRLLLNGRYGLDVLLPLAKQASGLNILPPVRCAIVDANGLVVDHGMIEPDLYAPPRAATPDMIQRLGEVSALAATPIPDQPKGPFSIVPHETADVGGKLIGQVYTPVVGKQAAVSVPT